jgi:Flp pilus assembly protein TadG
MSQPTNNLILRNTGEDSAADRCPPGHPERGASLILFSFMVVTILAPMIGFAIDGSICYWMKTKLSSSVDSAALAAARSLSLASDLSQLQTQGASTALEYFNANFQTGTMGTSLPNVALPSPCATSTNPCTTVDQSSAQKIIVTVQATVSVPLYFLRILGHSSANLSDTGQATRRSANIMMVLDRSWSMVLAGSCGTLVSSAQNFVNYFVNGRDTLGLVTFQVTANTDYALTQSFKSATPSLSTTIGEIQCTGYTNMTEGLHLAYNALNTLDQPDALNVIVLFTDGRPDTLVGNFPVKSLADNSDRYVWDYYPNAGFPCSDCGNIQSNSPASACTGTAASFSGIIVDVDGSPDSTGYTAGLFPDTPTAINYTSPYILPLPASPISGASCAQFSTTTSPASPEYTYSVRADIAGLPTTGLDAFNNSFTSGFTSLSSCCTYTAGPYSTPPAYYRVDTPESIMNAAFNSSWNQANLIRSSGIYIYTIGLGGTTFQEVNPDFLMQLANDPTLPSSEYNSTQPAGTYVYATAGTLGQAFEQIASQILRLSQ